METNANLPRHAESTGNCRQRVVTLVHGTWARNATWIRPASTFRRHLAQIEPEPIICTFQWTGRNSHRARLHAAEDLARQLRSSFAEYPSAEHHVIAHSHGGNVALYALRDSAIPERLASVVCLATPFIHARTRPIEPVIRVLHFLTHAVLFTPGVALAFIALLLTLLAATPLTGPLSSSMYDESAWVVLLLFGLLGLCGLFLWVGRRIATQVMRWIVARLPPLVEQYQRRLVDNYNHLSRCAVHVLNVQVERDEPALWLRALRWASEPEGDSRMAIKGATAFTLILASYAGWRFLQDLRVMDSVTAVVFQATLIIGLLLLFWLALLVLGFFISHLIFIAMPLLFRAHGAGFGEWSLFANWLVLIEARAKPDGEFRLESLRIAAKGKGLRHSRIYEDTRVLELIERWLTRENNRRSSP